jgi:preprotein translocase subunit YajC
LQGYIFILVLLALMWFLLIRPQRRRQQEAQQLVNSLEVGAEIVTAGGLYGTITEVDEDEVHVEIADGVEVRVAKKAVAGVVSEDEDEEEEEEEEDEEELEDEEGPADEVGGPDAEPGETPATLRRE